ncbi:MAG: septum site-determining protein MinC [Lachnospiraceae bacterium]|nr:septum site-determining protein MinC [Lachnospiraceae bacterium]
MKDAVVIKSYQNGINLIMREDVPFEQITEELSAKFRSSRSFFGNADVALSYEGRRLEHGQELALVDAIRLSSDLNLVCVVGKDEETNRRYIKAIQKVQQKLPLGSEGQLHKGSLKNREVLETESSIIILGDVYPGSAVMSPRNIIVLGGLYGEAYAGTDGREGAYVAALEMEPERLKIGDFKYKNNDRQTKWGIRSKVQPKIAHLKNDKIVMEPLTKEILDTF